MSLRRVILIGAGGHAKVIADILKKDRTMDIVGCTDNNPGSDLLGIPILGDDSILPELYDQGIRHAFVAVGDNRLRSLLAQKVTRIGFELVNAMSPHAYVADSVELGNGIAVMAGAVIHAEARIGDCTIINTQASVDHECVIGEGCHIAPGSTLSGNVTVGSGTFLGTGTKVIDGIRIGAWSMIGAGSIVVRDLPDGCLAMGVPARVVRKL